MNIKSVSISLFLLLFVASIQANTDENNLVSNPSFENFEDNWGFSSDSELASSEIVKDAYLGLNALQIISTQADDKEWTLEVPIYHASKLAVTPGDTLYYSIMVKATSISGGLSKSFITYNASGAVVSWNAGVTDISMEYDEYVQYASKYVIPEGVVAVVPRLMGYGSCDVTVDDFNIRGSFFVAFSTLGAGSISVEDGYYKLGSKVSISATPSNNNKFVAWGGDYISDINSDEFIVTGDMAINARFINENEIVRHQFYVAPLGSDANDGSINSPWKSIEYGSNQLYPGDTLIVTAGTYRQITSISNSGGNDKYITILGEEGAIIEETSSFNGSIFTVNDANYVIIDGITVQNAKAHGIKIWGRCDHVVIRNCKTIHTDGCGILVQGSRGYTWDGIYYASNIIIENNEVHWPQEGVWNGHLLWHEDITLMYGVEHFEVRNNYVNAYDTVQFDGGPIGIDVKDGVRYGAVHHNTVENIPCTGLYVDAWNSYVHHIDVYSNYVNKTTAYGIQIGAERGGPIDSVRVFNNIINKPRWCGIVSGDYTGGDEPAPQPKTHVDIFNNTIYEIGTGWGYGIFTQSSFQQGKVYNNIIYNAEKDGMSVNLGDGNLVTNNCINRLAGDFGDNIILSDPKFVDAAHGDFSLMINSRCIDAGTSKGAPSFDYDGKDRPLGLGIDIGAYEAEVVSGLNNVTSFDGELRVSPNPLLDYATVSYSVTEYSNVILSIYDIHGKQIEILVNKEQAKGNYSVDWDVSNYISGVYLYRLSNGSTSVTKKVMVNK